MVCNKCQAKSQTSLATPGVKKKSEMYYGSPASSSSAPGEKKATLGQTGVTKVSVAKPRHDCHLAPPGFVQFERDQIY